MSYTTILSPILLAASLLIGRGESAPAPSSNAPSALEARADFWRPGTGTSWQIVLSDALTDFSQNVQVYDIDLFANPASTIQTLHSQGRKVICYFSAGSYEDYRSDSGDFQASDYRNPLDGWEGEWWLDTNSANVRNIMRARLNLAKTKGCDGVDPDNVDGYDNDTGFDLSTSDAVNYMTFLANEAHALGMAIGLKNAGDIVNQVVGIMEWEVNEQCNEYDECDLFQPFINAGKPVFHIEYPDDVQSMSESQKDEICDENSVDGFSTLLKEMDLNDFVKICG